MNDTAPTLTAVLTTWTPSPIVDTLVALGAVGYPWLVVRTHRAGRPWPPIRLLCWYAGLACLEIAVDSALATYAHVLFTAHMVVHLLMIMVVPALLVAAHPILLLHNASGSRVRRAIEYLSGSPLRLLVSARFAVPLYTAVIVLTHLTGFQQAMATHMWIHDAELLLYFATGCLLFARLLGDTGTTNRSRPYSLRLFILAVCMGPDTLVGVTLMMGSSVLAPAYSASRTWGPSALADQSAAGVIMWVGGDGLMMLLMVIVAGQWVRSGDHGFGPWLDTIRQNATLGESHTGAVDIDDGQDALDVYNARLAELNGPRPSHAHRTRPQEEAT